MAQPIMIKGAKPKYILLDVSFYKSPLHSARKALGGHPDTQQVPLSYHYHHHGHFLEWHWSTLSELRAFFQKPPQMRGLYNLHFEIKRSKESKRWLNTIPEATQLESDSTLINSGSPETKWSVVLLKARDRTWFAQDRRKALEDGWSLNQKPCFSEFRLCPFRESLPLPNLLTNFKLSVKFPSTTVVSGISALCLKENNLITFKILLQRKKIPIYIPAAILVAPPASELAFLVSSAP